MTTERNRWVQFVLGFIAVLVVTSVAAQDSLVDAAAAASTRSAPNTKEIRAANRTLRKAVLRNLSRTKGLDVGRIVVVKKGGSILLDGHVPESSQIDLATSAAQCVPGMGEVSNHLIVRAEEP